MDWLCTTQNDRNVVASTTLPGGQSTVPAQFERTLSIFPDKAAVFSGSESLTFRQLHAEAMATAQALASLGVSPGDRIGICM